METKNLNTKYCVGLGEILFDVLPTGSQLGGAPANLLTSVVSEIGRSTAELRTSRENVKKNLT